MCFIRVTEVIGSAAQNVLIFLDPKINTGTKKSAFLIVAER